MARTSIHCRENMPHYAEDNAFVVSGEQLKKILRGRNPFKEDSPKWNKVHHRSSYRITQLRDGTWWVENFRSGASLFAPDYWWRIPEAAGARAFRLKEFVDENL